MMAKVKCRYCGKKIDKQSAFSPVARRYYCSSEEYNKTMDNRLFINKIKLLLSDLFEYQIVNTFLDKRISELSKNYSYEDIYKTIQEITLDLQFALISNNFQSENHKINYIFAIIKNNINDVVTQNNIVIPTEKVPQSQPQFQSVNKYKPRKKKALVKDIIFGEE